MSKWESQLEQYFSMLEKIRKDKSGLRFNKSFIIASDIALQYFCEKKIEMMFVQGDVETESKILGAEAHERLLQDIPEIKMRDLWAEIYGKKPILVLEMLVLAHYKGIVLAGRPDSILFTGGVPKMIFEYKFTRSRRPFKNHHVQAQTYGVILRNMEFDTKNLFYALVLVNPKAEKDKELKKRVYEAVTRNGLEEATMSVKNARIYINKFNEDIAERDIDWALEFWKYEREAFQTTNPNKCESCEYSIVCQMKAAE